MLLRTEEFADSLLESVAKANESLQIFSAFIKKHALESFVPTLRQGLIEVSVVARWQMSDLLSGASDLEVYELCRQEGWRFGIDLNLHGKLYVIDSKQIFLGSANLTGKGILEGSSGNKEFGVKISADQADLQMLKSFVREEVIWMTDELYEQLEKLLSNQSTSDRGSRDISWPIDLMNELQRPVRYLWFDELPNYSPSVILSGNNNQYELEHDLMLLNIREQNVSRSILKVGFLQTRAYKWLVYQLGKNDEKSFGNLSSSLHNSLMDEKRIFRKDVKVALETLFAWMEYLPEYFVVTKYDRSQSVHMVS